MSSEKDVLSIAEEHMTIIIPIVSVITILMFIGVIGNGAVIYIYGFTLKNSTVHYFITLLAVFDFICCLLGFPMEIIEFYFSMDYPSNGLCKWQRFITFFCSTGSVVVLLLISIERYRKVCQPTKHQLTLRHAKYLAIGASIFSLLTATPMTLFSINRQVPLKRFGNQTGYDCRMSDQFGKGPLSYFLFLLIFITITLATMVVLYSLVWKTAKRHFSRSDSRFQRTANNAEAESSPAKRQLSRTNRTVISVTALFIISFFPTMLLSIFADRLMDLMTFKEELVFFMFVRIYILSSSFNPVVYGLCNKYFRNAFVGLFRKMFCLSSREPQSSSTETS